MPTPERRNVAGHHVEVETSFTAGRVRALCQCGWQTEYFSDTAAAVSAVRKHFALQRLLASQGGGLDG